MKKALKTALILAGACLLLTTMTVNHTVFAQEEGEDLVNDPAIQEALSYLMFHDALFEDDNKTMPAWLTYGFARLGWIKEHMQVPFADITQETYLQSYEEELYGRENLVAVWEELKEQDTTLSDTYLDEMITVRKAGYLPEYVWLFTYFETNEGAPSDERVQEFDMWYFDNIPDHEPQTMVGLAWEDYEDKEEE